MKIKEKVERHIEKAKNYIACAIEELRDIPKDSEEYEENDIDTCIRELEDIQIIKL